MTTLMSTHSLQMSAGHLPLFDHLELGIRAGDRLGLIGANGCGKSTLLALLAGERTPQAGRVVQAASFTRCNAIDLQTAFFYKCSFWIQEKTNSSYADRLYFISIINSKQID
ncbi:ATP-binding cassette domain-containing protein, partial [Aeromonas caviae]